MVIGGQAVLIYGEPRFTNDIDITIGLDIGKVDMMLEIVENLGLKIPVMNVQEFVSKTMVLPAIHEKSKIRAILFSRTPNTKKKI